MDLTPVERALDARAALLEADPDRAGALRLFNGFTEGLPALSIELYGRALVLHDYGAAPAGDRALSLAALALCRSRLPFVTAALRKVRRAKEPALRVGEFLLGSRVELPVSVREEGVSYALDLELNRDTSFYLDTRFLRRWVRDNLAGKSLLNAFAYTGSLGVAARAGGARPVVQTDLSEQFLRLVYRGYELNGWPLREPKFMLGDYFAVTARLRNEDRLFDCVIVDPPFFSKTPGGKVDLVESMERVLNKARPLVAHGGALVAVNNAVFVSGAAYEASLARMCESGYLTVEARIDVPDDARGFVRAGPAVADPAPYGHSTKIAVLRATRKDGRGAA